MDIEKLNSSTSDVLNTCTFFCLVWRTRGPTALSTEVSSALHAETLLLASITPALTTRDRKLVGTRAFCIRGQSLYKLTNSITGCWEQQ